MQAFHSFIPGEYLLQRVLPFKKIYHVCRYITTLIIWKPIPDFILLRKKKCKKLFLVDWASLVVELLLWIFFCLLPLFSSLLIFHVMYVFTCAYVMFL